MKGILITESQMSFIVKSLISEQNLNIFEFSGATDANAVTHKLLSQKFGLPYDEKQRHENFYYQASIPEIINISNGDRSKFLSVFKPLSSYSKDKYDPRFLYDYININNEELKNTGSKRFALRGNGNIIASHNGLLALTRAMETMKGNGGNVTIAFGSNKKGKEAEGERVSSSINFNSAAIFDQEKTRDSIEEGIATFMINPNFLETSKAIWKQIALNNKLESAIKNFIKNNLIGLNSFLPKDRENEVITALTPKGYISNVDFLNLDSIIQQLKSVSNINDMQNGRYNDSKYNTIKQKFDGVLKEFGEKYKNAYITNLNLFVENYLPNYKNYVLKNIPNLKFPPFSGNQLAEVHKSMFYRTLGPASQSQAPQMQTTNKTYKSGD